MAVKLTVLLSYNASTKEAWFLIASLQYSLISLSTRLRIWKGVFTPKMHQCFPSTLLWRNLEMQQSLVISWIGVWGKLGEGNDVIIVTSSFFLKLCFQNLFARKRKTSVFKFFRYEERFRQVPFSWRINVDGRPNRGKKGVFLNSSGVVSTLQIGYRENWAENSDLWSCRICCSKVS